MYLDLNLVAQIFRKLLQHVPKHAKVVILKAIVVISINLKVLLTHQVISNKNFSNTDQSLVLSSFMKIFFPIKVVFTNIRLDKNLAATLSKLLVMVMKTEPIIS